MNICADDYGMNQSIDAAILELIDLKKVTSVSVLIRPLTNSSLNSLKMRQNSVQIGLHLDIFGPHFPLFLYRLLFRKKLIADEIRWQAEEFQRRFGFSPQYYDGHMHCHIYPVVSRILADILPSLPVAKPVQIRSVHIPETVRNKAGKANAVYLQMLEWFNTQAFRNFGTNAVPGNDFLYGSFNNHIDIEECFNLYTSHPSQKPLFFCHPGLTTTEDKIERKKEYEFLKAR